MRKPIPKTQEQLEADAKAAEEAARAELEKAEPVAEKPVPTPEAPVVEPVKTETPPEPKPVPVEVKSDEVELLKTQLAEMTKRVRDEDGRHGGKLAALQQDMSRVSDQLRQVLEENRELRRQKPAEPVAPPEPDPLEGYQEVAKGVERRTKPIAETAQRAEELSKLNADKLSRMEAAQAARETAAFVDGIRSAIPKMDEHNANPDFAVWCNQEDPDTGEIRQDIFRRCMTTMKNGPAIKLYQKWERETKPVPVSQVEPAPKAPAKPSKEAQVEVPKSSDTSTKSKTRDLDKEVIELRDKIFRFGTATKDDRLKYEQLLDEQERAKQQ